MAAAKIFVSYSHKDARWLERLQVHLKPLVREGHIDLWADTRLRAGSEWHAEIKDAIASASIAILLVSADFFASDFIASDELPPLLEAGSERGLRIMSVICSASRFTHSALAKYQTVNPPDRPLIEMAEGECERIFTRLSEEIDSFLNVSVAAPPSRLVARTDDSKIVELITMTQSRKVPLAECIAMALQIAKTTGDVELVEFCTNELTGKIPSDQTAPNVAPRTIEVFCSFGGELDLGNTSLSPSDLFSHLRTSEDFAVRKIYLHHPIGVLEARTVSDAESRVMHWDLPIRSFVPNAKDPNHPIHLYAPGETVGRVTENVRVELTRRLVALLP